MSGVGAECLLEAIAQGMLESGPTLQSLQRSSGGTNEVSSVANGSNDEDDTDDDSKSSKG